MKRMLLIPILALSLSLFVASAKAANSSIVVTPPGDHLWGDTITLTYQLGRSFDPSADFLSVNLGCSRDGAWVFRAADVVQAPSGTVSFTLVGSGPAKCSGWLAYYQAGSHGGVKTPAWSKSFDIS